MRWCIPAAAWLLCDLLIVMAIQDVGPRRGVPIAAMAMALALIVTGVVVRFARRSAVAITLAAVSFAAFAAVATVKAPEHQIKLAYRSYLQAQATGDPRRVCAVIERRHESEADCLHEWEDRLEPRVVSEARRLLSLEVDGVSIIGDGDLASATLRSGPCTITFYERFFRRGPDGEWRYTSQYGSGGWASACRERGVDLPGFWDSTG